MDTEGRKWSGELVRRKARRAASWAMTLYEHVCKVGIQYSNLRFMTWSLTPSPCMQDMACTFWQIVRGILILESVIEERGRGRRAWGVKG